MNAACQLPTALDQWAIRATRWLVALIAFGFALFPAAMSFASAQQSYLVANVVVLLTTITATYLSARAQDRGALVASFEWIYAAYVAAVCITAITTFPAIDRWHDLGTLARQIHADSEHRELALLDPDETTIAMLDYQERSAQTGRPRTPFTILSLDSAVTDGKRNTPDDLVAGWLTTHGSSARVLVLLPGHASGELTGLLEHLHPLKAPDDGIAGTLRSRGVASILRRYDVPHGRRYALLGPP
jgi:hypothetical protein